MTTDAAREAAWRRRGIVLTVKQYNALAAKQGGKCAICRRPPKSRRLAVDHDHKTGKVRGLLCFYCNYRVVRKWKVDKLRQVLAYLEQSETDSTLKSAPALKRGRGGGRV